MLVTSAAPARRCTCNPLHGLFALCSFCAPVVQRIRSFQIRLSIMLIETNQVVRVQFGEQFGHFAGSEMTEGWECFRAEDDGVGLVAAEVIDERDQPDVKALRAPRARIPSSAGSNFRSQISRWHVITSVPSKGTLHPPCCFNCTVIIHAWERLTIPSYCEALTRFSQNIHRAFRMGTRRTSRSDVPTGFANNPAGRVWFGPGSHGSPFAFRPGWL